MEIIKIKGKKSSQIAKENGVSLWRVNQYAKDHKISYVSFDDGVTVDCYVFDEEAEREFITRRGRGRPSIPKPPITPKKIGRPKKENKETPKKQVKTKK